MVYLRLHGNNCSLVHTMYAAILRASETGEYDWNLNFDRFENIMHQKVWDKKDKDKDKMGKKKEGTPLHE